MDAKLSNPYARLTEYFRLFKAYDCSEFDYEDTDKIPIVTISFLSKKLDIPLNIMRMDITNIMRYSEGGVLDFDIDEDDDALDLEVLMENPERLFDYINAGFLDDVGLNFYDTFTSDCSAFVSEEEIKALEKTSSIELPFLVKDNEFEMIRIADLIEMVEIVEEAIKGKRYISFMYLDGEKIDSVSIVPLKIVYADRKYSILTCIDGVPQRFYFSGIKTGITIGEVCDYPPNSAYLTIMPQVWGMEFLAEPYLVSVRFYNEGDVFNRVRSELSGRTMGQLYEEDEFLIYEDTVYGLDSFKEWVYSFGSSAVVLKPKSLREEIIKELKDSLQ